MTVKDYVTLTLSILAFSVSVLLAYLNTFKRTDDVKVAFKSVPDIDAEWNEPGKVSARLGETHPEAELLLINSGNRPAVLTGAWFTLRFVRNDTPESDICKGEVIAATTPVQAIKANDAQSAVVKLGSPEVFDGLWQQAGKHVRFHYYPAGSTAAKPADDFDLRACIHLVVTTPSASYAVRPIEILRAHSDATKNKSAVKATRPFELYKRETTIFNSD